MNFLAETHHVWPVKPSDETLNQVIAQGNLMASQGETDGQWEIVHLEGTTVEIVRKWTTVEAADAWVDFITQFPGVSSATVVRI